MVNFVCHWENFHLCKLPNVEKISSHLVTPIAPYLPRWYCYLLHPTPTFLGGIATYCTLPA